MDEAFKTTAVRFIIPIHPPKMNYLSSFLLSYDRSSDEKARELTEIVLIVTNDQEHSIIKAAVEALRLSFAVKFLNVESYVRDSMGSEALLSHLQAGFGGGMVNIKKLACMHWVASQNGDSVAACFDVDTLCLRWRAEDVRTMVKNNAREIYFGTSKIDHPSYIDILDSSLGILGNIGERVIDKLGDKLHTYTWFFDIPTYRSDRLRQFFKDMEEVWGSLETCLLHLHSRTFDHLIYIYWMVSQGASVVDYSDIGIVRIPEHIPLQVYSRISQMYDYQGSWVTALRYLENPSSYNDSAGPAFIYHIDRF